MLSNFKYFLTLNLGLTTFHISSFQNLITFVEISCTSVLDNSPPFQLNYDHLVIACGASSNTFNIPGVEENAFFLKEIGDAKKIRGRVIECKFHKFYERIFYINSQYYISIKINNYLTYNKK
jgi:hypothetical protein